MVTSLAKWQHFLLTVIVIVAASILAWKHVITGEAITAILGAGVPTGALLHFATTGDTSVAPDTTTTPEVFADQQ